MASTGAKRMVQGRRLAWLLWAVCSGCAQMCGIEEGELIDMSAGAGGEDGLAGGGSGGQGEPGGSAGSGGTAPDASVPLDCEVYCQQITAVCRGANAQFVEVNGAPGLAQCRAMCPLYEDDLECRYGMVERAEGRGDDIRELCSAAGPAGWSLDITAQCTPSLCDAFCDLMAQQCVDTALDTLKPDAGVSYRDSCMEICSGLDEPEPGDDLYLVYLGAQIGDGRRAEVTGNNVQCRILHVGNAAADIEAGAASVHCTHAAGDSICR